MHECGSHVHPGMPLAEIFVLCGFFMIYLVEEVTHVVLRRCHPRPPSSTGGGGGGDDDLSKRPPPPPGVHGHGEEDLMYHAEHTFEATLRGFLVILALSLHAVFEGIALGLASNEKSVWFIFFAIASHKYVISFCVGMQFVTSGVRPAVSVLYVSTFAFISPLGAAVGLAMSGASPELAALDPMQAEASLQNAVVTVLQGLATGTLLYVVFFEVIEKERSKGTNGMMQVMIKG